MGEGVGAGCHSVPGAGVGVGVRVCKQTRWGGGNEEVGPAVRSSDGMVRWRYGESWCCVMIPGRLPRQRTGTPNSCINSSLITLDFLPSKVS